MVSEKEEVSKRKDLIKSRVHHCKSVVRENLQVWMLSHDLILTSSPGYHFIFLNALLRLGASIDARSLIFILSQSHAESVFFRPERAGMRPLGECRLRPITFSPPSQLLIYTPLRARSLTVHSDELEPVPLHFALMALCWMQRSTLNSVLPSSVAQSASWLQPTQ